MRLHRLTGLEQDKIVTEFNELLELIRDLGEILARPERLLSVIRDELDGDEGGLRRRAPHPDRR